MHCCVYGGFSSRWSSIVSPCACDSMPKMPWGWGKSASKDSRKGCKDILVDGLESPRLQSVSARRGGGNKHDEEAASGGRHARMTLDVTQQNSDPRSVFAISSFCSRSPSPSTPSTRCPSFNDKKPPPQPLPLPTPLARTCSDTGVPVSHAGNARLLHSSASVPSHGANEHADGRNLAYDPNEIEVGTSGAASCTNSSVSVSSLGSEDPWNHGAAPAATNLSRLRPGHDADATEQGRHQIAVFGSVTPKHSRKNSRHDVSRPSSPLIGAQTPSSSPKIGGHADQKRNLSPIRLEPAGQRFHPLNGSAPDSSYSSPARSPRRVSNSDQVTYVGGGQWIRHDGGTVTSSSAQGSSPGSGHNSGHYSGGGGADPSQMMWNNQFRRSPEVVSIHGSLQRTPSVSPTPSAAPSAPLSPQHMRPQSPITLVAPMGPESPTSWHEDAKSPAHRLPLPPPPGGGSPILSPPVSPTPGRIRSDTIFVVSSGTAPTRWQKGKLLGSGTFGNVYVGFNSDNGALCAMKEVLLVTDDSKSKESVKQLGQEIALLSRLRHPNIVQYIGTEALEDKLCIYLEYVSGGSIHKLLQEYGYFKEPVIRSFTRQILRGLAYLHNMNTVHRDVKGANILVDTNGKVKLADFGMAKHITAQSFPLSFKGSPYWMAPEVIKHTNGYDLAVDVWSLGCTVLEMATAKPPWSQYEGVAAMFKIGNSKELPVIPDTLSADGKDFVRQCLQRDPSLRPTAQKLLKHRFVENLPDDRFDSPQVMASTTSAVQNLGLYRHDSEGTFPQLQPSRTRQLSPSSSDLSRNTAVSYGPSNPNSLSPTGQSRHHVYNGLSSLPHSPRVQSGASTPHNGAYGSPHGSSHGFGLTPSFPGSNYAALPVPCPEVYNNVSRSNGIYGNPPLMNGGYNEQPSRSDFHWGTSHRTPEGSPYKRDLQQHEDILDMALGRVKRDQDESKRRLHTLAQPNLGDQISQQFSRRPKLGSPNVGLYQHRPTSPILGRVGSELSH